MLSTRTKGLDRIKSVMLRERAWEYLHYQHLREGLLLADGIRTVHCVGAGKAYAELALALEFPDLHFHITEFETAGSAGHEVTAGWAEELEVTNVTWGSLDLLEPPEMNWDLVTTIASLDRFEDDAAAACRLLAMANQYVFALVPFAHAAASTDPLFRARVWEKRGAYRVGYDQAELEALFPLTVETRGCHWDKEGRKFRRQLASLENDQIEANRGELLALAARDVRREIPEAIAEASGIWTLARTR